MSTLIVTGGAGFIGSHFVELALQMDFRVVVVDSLTYAGNPDNVERFSGRPNFVFHQGDIRDFAAIRDLIFRMDPVGLINFAAESHVDNSIEGPKPFIETNILGTFQLLEAAREYCRRRVGFDKFRFLHVSTDEVFGELGPTGYFSETSPYSPNSPYSASKAASDHLSRAWHETYGLDVVVTHCSNNYGPRQFPEKLIPRMIQRALRHDHLPVYGRGENIRDWIHVEDHCRGVLLAFNRGVAGQSYCFAGRAERKNIELVTLLCQILDEKRPRADGKSYRELIQFVSDRPGHDLRYAIDDRKAEAELGFQRKFSSLEQGLRETVDWYLGNGRWLEQVEKRARDFGRSAS
ncbi:MAG: dTDP-glucose 4,6-dehydratase [Bdellovibrio sp.]|nr:MAG: dTDP-glucose 4,6-dehydratase [Bdellovibrio sp.]